MDASKSRPQTAKPRKLTLSKETVKSLTVGQPRGNRTTLHGPTCQTGACCIR
jgi:hypothetical protein